MLLESAWYIAANRIVEYDFYACGTATTNHVNVLYSANMHL